MQNANEGKQVLISTSAMIPSGVDLTPERMADAKNKMVAKVKAEKEDEKAPEEKAQ